MSNSKERLTEEVRQFHAHLAAPKVRQVASKVEAVLKSAFSRHREWFVQRQIAAYLGLAAQVVEGRKSNETISEWQKRVLDWPAKTDQSPDAGDHRLAVLGAVGRWEAVAYWLTTYPPHTSRTAEWGVFRGEQKVPPLWSDALSREEWEDDGDRADFRVALKSDAPDLARKHAELVVSGAAEVFVCRAVSRVLPVLKRQRHYYASLESCSVRDGVAEADIRITFMDTRSFLLHAAIKQNIDAGGAAAWQYALSYQSVRGEPGERPVKFLLPAAVEELFGVTGEDRWQPTFVVEKKPRWRAAKSGDVVRLAGRKAVGLLLGRDKAKKGNVLVKLASGKSLSLPAGDVEGVFARIEAKTEDGKTFTYSVLGQDWTVQGPHRVLRSLSKTLEKQYQGKAKGSWAASVAGMAFEKLCEAGELPGSRTKADKIAA